MIEIIKNTKIDFMSKRFIALGISAILTILGFVAAFHVARGTANLGIDFAGGTSVQIKFNSRTNLHDVRKALEEGGIRDAELQDLPTENKMLISIKKSEGNLGDLSGKIITILSQKFSHKNVVVDSTTEIGPKVGGKLRRDALVAILVATLGILVYVAFRFQFRFGVGATIATFHDVMAVLGIFYIMGREINLLLVTALLTIAGYSLTDTVVVFDRIRENLRSRLKKSAPEIVNESVNEVLSRTIVTSLTVLLTSVALFLFGGEVIHDFSLAMILGVVVGTYSSIFVASPVVLMLGKEKTLSRKK
ncbi:MAG: protein translocase subunit SecF [Nitrospirota bacterium]